LNSALKHGEKSQEYLNRPEIPGILRYLGGLYAQAGLIENMDIMSNGQGVKVQLRCSSSGCFDMHNICCKACGIKKCRYKCNYIDSEICEYQYIK